MLRAIAKQLLLTWACVTCCSGARGAETPSTSSEKEAREVDRILAERYPIRPVTPLGEFVTDYSKLPEKVIPETVKLLVPTVLSIPDGGASKTIEAGQTALLIKITKTEVTLGDLKNREMVGSAKVDDTDLKERAEFLYRSILDASNKESLEQREVMRPKVLAHLRGEPESRPQNSSSGFNSKSYGRDFTGDYFPEIRNGLGEKRDHEIPLGPLGGKALVLYGGKEASISELWPKGPGAKAGLQLGDRILKAGGKTFKNYSSKSGGSPEGFPKAIGLAMIEAQATDQPLELSIDRAGEELQLRIELPHLPDFSDTFPSDCKRSAFLLNAAAEYLADQQKSDGTWHAQDYGNAWCALSLLATGDKQYAKQIKTTARHLATKYEIKANPSHEDLIATHRGALDNWRHCMVGIFLAEYLLATGDKSVAPALEACCRRIEARLQPGSGRLGHQTTNLPYKGTGLVIINVQAHIMWALAANINGMEWDWDPWELSFKSVTDAMRVPGAVGYSVRSPGAFQSGTRSGAMATALTLADREKSMRGKMGDWLSSTRIEFPNTHAMTSLGIVYGFMGIKNAAPKAMQDCYDDYRWMFSLTTPPNARQGTYYYGCRANHTGDKYLKRRLVANWVTIMALCTHRSDTLWIFGNRKRDWY